jgi:hypothetical protein
MRQVPEKQLGRRRRAVAALGDHTAEVLDQLRDAEDELLAGEQPGTGHNVVYCYCTATVLPLYCQLEWCVLLLCRVQSWLSMQFWQHD